MSSFPIPESWGLDTKESKRDERKRKLSPASFFYSQGKALVLASKYFEDSRLAEKSRGGVAKKHRHRIELALFGQLLASFEYMLKDFVSQQVDATSLIDEAMIKAKWPGMDASRLLSLRSTPTTLGAILVHPTTGWHNPDQVNTRYASLFEREIIRGDEKPTLEQLWVIRHTVAHNAGFMIAHDAARVGSKDVSERVINLGGDFISETFDFLCNIASRLANEVGDHMLDKWLQTRIELSKNVTRDLYPYTLLRYLATYLPSRPRDLPDIASAEYEADYDKAVAKYA